MAIDLVVLGAVVGGMLVAAGAQAGEAFYTLLPADTQLVAGRLMAGGVVDGRYAVAQLRTAEATGPGTWRLTTERTVVFDCQAQPPLQALVQQGTNTQPADEPPQWQSTTMAVPPQPGGMLVFRAEDLTFSALPEDEAPLPAAAADTMAPLRLPGVWQVGAAFACAAAATPDKVAQVAAGVALNAGLPDLKELVCPLTNEARQPAGVLKLAYSPTQAAVRVGEKWVSVGVFAPAFLAMSDGDTELRLLRTTGVLRLVRRSEMRGLGHGQCAPAPAGGVPQRTSRW